MVFYEGVELHPTLGRMATTWGTYPAPYKNMADSTWWDKGYFRTDLVIGEVPTEYPAPAAVPNSGGLQILRSKAIQAIFVGNGLYIDNAGTPGLVADQYGNILGGTNPGVAPQFWDASNNNFTANVSVLFDFAYVGHTRRTMSRHFFATELNNPGNLQLGRVNCPNDLYPYATSDDTQFGTPDYTHQSGVLATQTLGRIVFRGTLAPFGAGAGGIGATHQQSSVDVYGQAEEDFLQTASGNHFATGGGFYIATRPLGDVSGLGSDANPDRFGIDARGTAAIYNLAWAKGQHRTASAAGWLTRGDLLVATNLRALSNVIAQQHATGGANTVTMVMGAIGPSSEPGIQFGTAVDNRLYHAAASGGVKAAVLETSLRANYLTLLSVDAVTNRIRANYLATTDRLRDTGSPSWAIDFGDSDLMTMRRAAATAGSPSYSAFFQLSGEAAIADGETAMLVRRNVGGTFTLQRVSMGAADSGGAGFKLLRVAN